MTMNNRLKKGIGVWTSYYRSNPHRFIEDYMHIKLKLFQKIMIVIMNIMSTVCFIGCRGIGKTYLTALFCVQRCILYPGTKIVIVSGTRGQALQVFEKIKRELMPRSAELRGEINDKESKENGTIAQIVFNNTSYIKVVTGGESARGNRANVLIIDEARLVRKDIIDTIFKQFLTLYRAPAYSKLSETERREAYKKEENITMYLTSAYFSDSWIFTKCQDTFRYMLEGRKQFVCGLPYELSIKEGLLRRDKVEEEMLESDFSEIKFSINILCCINLLNQQSGWV